MIESAKYTQWLKNLKLRIRQSQIKAAVKVNVELLKMYWDMGRDIATRKMDSQWGTGFFEQLSRDLRRDFPDMQGFSSRNIRYIKDFYCFYANGEKVLHQAGAEFPKGLFLILWRHQVELISKCKSVEEALFYVRKTLENGWSRNVLVCMIETGMFEAQGKALTNFSTQLPAPMSDLAQQALKAPYVFDFFKVGAFL